MIPLIHLGTAAPGTTLPSLLAYWLGGAGATVAEPVEPTDTPAAVASLALFWIGGAVAKKKKPKPPAHSARRRTR